MNAFRRLPFCRLLVGVVLLFCPANAFLECRLSELTEAAEPIDRIEADVEFAALGSHLRPRHCESSRGRRIQSALRRKTHSAAAVARPTAISPHPFASALLVPMRC